MFTVRSVSTILLSLTLFFPSMVLAGKAKTIPADRDLVSAVAAVDFEKAMQALNNGADVNARGDSGQTDWRGDMDGVEGNERE